MNLLGINKRFSKVTALTLQITPNELYVPVEGKISAIEPIKKNHSVIIKKKPVHLQEKLGKYSTRFDTGTVCSFYLAPTNKHFRILPTSGMVVDIIRNNGTAKRRKTIIGAEKMLAYIPLLRHMNLLQSALERNCTDTTILKTEEGYIALIALGSLGVNYIHNRLIVGNTYTAGTIAGHFALGSSMLMVCSEQYHLKHLRGKVVHGTPIGQKKIP